jgi:SAM-dependent methyltransferase
LTAVGREHWDGLARVWERARPTPLWRRHSDAVNSALIERWLPTRVRRVLKTDLFDEAMSMGLYPALVGRAEEVVGVDVSSEIVNAAAARHQGLQARQADVRNLPFEDGSFDAVVSNSTLDHFQDEGEIVRALRELHRVLRPRGRVILTLDNPSNPLNAIAKALPRDWLNSVWVRHARVTARVGHVPYHVGETMSARRLRTVLPCLGYEIQAQDAIMHAPRPVAVVVAELVARRGSERSQRRLLETLTACERLSDWPTRYLTGHFVAVSAVKRPS